MELDVYYPILAYARNCEPFSHFPDDEIEWARQPGEVALSTPRVTVTIASFLSFKPLLLLSVMRRICKPCAAVTVHAAVAMLRPDLSDADICEIVKADKRNVAPWLLVYRATGVIVVPVSKPLRRLSEPTWMLAQTKDNHRVVMSVNSEGVIQNVLSCSASSSEARRHKPLLGTAVTLCRKPTSSNCIVQLANHDKWVVVKHAL